MFDSFSFFVSDYGSKIASYSAIVGLLFFFIGAFINPIIIRFNPKSSVLYKIVVTPFIVSMVSIIFIISSSKTKEIDQKSTISLMDRKIYLNDEITVNTKNIKMEYVIKCEIFKEGMTSKECWRVAQIKTKKELIDIYSEYKAIK